MKLRSSAFELEILIWRCRGNGSEKGVKININPSSDRKMQFLNVSFFEEIVTDKKYIIYKSATTEV